MSSVSRNMKGFYKQKKNPNPTATNTKSSNSNKPPIHSSTSAPQSLISPNDEHNENETVLRQFDMNMMYGPCMGMTRLARWERAMKLGLNPPQEIETLLKNGKFPQESLWDNRI